MSVSVSPYLHGDTKRLLDVALAAGMLLVALPLMAAIAVLVLLCDGLPVVLLQQRVGRCGGVFTMPKFRTMRDEGDRGFQATSLGKFLRRHRLDELPQLVTVLRGHMSLVGPRPELVEIVSQYQPRHRRRLLAKPGVTGIWQIMGSRRRRIHQELRYDLYYLRRATILLDLKVLLRTVPFLFAPGECQT